MPANEPLPTAIALGTFGLLILLSALFSRTSGRLGVPVALFFLGVGMLAGSEGLGGLAFEDYSLSFRVGTAALVLILFDGGINTPAAAVREAWRPAAVLATLGVVLTALLVAAAAHAFGIPWREALLIGAIVSSTDAASVFSVLRGSGIQLRRRVGLTLELESGLNDPMAVLLTLALTSALAAGEEVRWAWVALQVPLQLGIGLGVGWAVGRLGRVLLARVPLSVGGLYPVVTTALAFVAFSSATLLWGSGFLAVYVAALVLGDGPLPYRAGLLRVHDAGAWFSQVGMFLLLGLLVFPSRLVEVAGVGLALGLLLAFVARPVAVLLCLVPFRYPLRERLYVSWVGLRGAVPIVLATTPIMSGVPGGNRIFDLVFFVVVVNALVPGSTIRWLTDRLKLRADEPPPPPAVLEISSLRQLDGSVLAFFIDPASAVANEAIADLPLPTDSAVMVIVRERELVPPRGAVVLRPGDHVYLITRPEHEPLLRLLFGRKESA